MNSEYLLSYEYFIELTIYMIFGIGAAIFMWGDIDLLFRRYRLRHRLRAVRTADKRLPEPMQYIFELINISFSGEFGKRFFIIAEAMLFIISYILAYRNYSYITAIAVSALTVAMPLLMLAVRLGADRAKASREAISLVSELHRQYRINRLNIYEAIEKTAVNEGAHPLSAKRLYSLLMRLRSACGPIETRDAVNSFVFSYGTFWAKMLGHCIRTAAEKGSDISEALSDIARQLRDASSLEEKRRLLNSEASRITLLLIPLMYIGCMATAVLYLGVEPLRLLKNQFLDPAGFMLFLICVFLFSMNMLILYSLSSSRFDF